MNVTDVAETSVASMTDDQIESFLSDRGVGVLALPDDDVPYLLPMSFGYDGERTLYFLFLLFGEQSRKQRLSDRASRAAFLVYRAQAVDHWRSVSLRGRIEPVPETEWEALRAAMTNAWHPDLFSAASPMRGVDGYRLHVETWTGIESIG